MEHAKPKSKECVFQNKCNYSESVFDSPSKHLPLPPKAQVPLRNPSHFKTVFPKLFFLPCGFKILGIFGNVLSVIAVCEQYSSPLSWLIPIQDCNALTEEQSFSVQKLCKWQVDTLMWLSFRFFQRNLLAALLK